MIEEERASFSASLFTIFSLKEAVSIPLSRNSSIGSSSSFLPIPYNTAATCLHNTAQSGQEHENLISLTLGKRLRDEEVKYSLKESGNLPFIKSSTDSKLFLHLSSKDLISISVNGVMLMFILYGLGLEPWTRALITPYSIFRSTTHPLLK